MANEYRESVREMLKEGGWTFGKILWYGSLALILVGAVGWFITMLAKPAALVNKVTDPDRIIQNYEWFEESYNDALALDEKIKTTQSQIDSQFSGMPTDRNEWSRSNQEEFNRLNSVVVGMRSQRESIVADYNARSKMITRQLWKNPALPYQIDVEDDQIKETW